MSGFQIAGFIILALIVIVTALALVKVNKPNSLVARDINTFDTAVRTEADKLFSDWKAAMPTVRSVGEAVKSEAESMLEAVEKKLTDVAGEDAKIAEHVAGIAAQNASKEFKKALLTVHVEKMQAHLATFNSAS